VSCALAGLAAAALTGALCGLFIFCCIALSGPRHVENVVEAIGWIIASAVLVGVVIGTTPAVLIICLSRARAAPWRSVPYLAGGAAVGLIVIGMPWSLLAATQDEPWLTLGMPLLGAMAGGAMATRFSPRGPAAGSVLPIAAIGGFFIGLIAGITMLVFSIGALLRHFGSHVSLPPMQRPTLIVVFVVYWLVGSIAFAVVIRRIAWNDRPLVKGLAAGLLASAFVIVGVASFAIPNP